MSAYNLVGVAPNISRLYEIAKVGGFSVRLITDPEPQPIDPKDLALFNEFYGFDPDVEDPDIVAELRFHYNDVMNAIVGRKYETLEDINARIAQCEFNEIAVDRTIKGATENLLKSALDKLSLGLADAIKIIDIAEVIAKLAFSQVIKPEHIAEAIHYKSVKLK